jgi:hypothetical protein
VEVVYAESGNSICPAACWIAPCDAPKESITDAASLKHSSRIPEKICKGIPIFIAGI